MTQDSQTAAELQRQAWKKEQGKHTKKKMARYKERRKEGKEIFISILEYAIRNTQYAIRLSQIQIDN